MKNKYNFWELLCFFISTMSIFSLFYCIKCSSFIVKKEITLDSLKCVFSNWNMKDCAINGFQAINFLIPLIIFLLGNILFIIFIARKQDLSDETNGEAYILKSSEMKDINDSNYFSRLSLFVLTGLSLPIENSIISIILLVLFLILLGSVYIREEMVYINPLISFFGYKLYEAKIIHIRNNEIKTVKILMKGKFEGETLINYTNKPTIFIKF